MVFIKIRKDWLNKKLIQLTTERKLKIEMIVNDILTSKKNELVGSIISVNEILYFINIAFIKMMAPDYKVEILSY